MHLCLFVGHGPFSHLFDQQFRKKCTGTWKVGSISISINNFKVLFLAINAFFIERDWNVDSRENQLLSHGYILMTTFFYLIVLGILLMPARFSFLKESVKRLPIAQITQVSFKIAFLDFQTDKLFKNKVN